ncbi:hypothetical protein T484DRAFT_1980268 [Baffinella frigidus]|nr:hypothetical protein T484DRAFT_1980268 [Cryptophyta sp. CCMP2293]
MLPCGRDPCHAVFHIACLNPPLHAVPTGEWLCPCCKILPLMLQLHDPSPPPQSDLPKKRSAPPLPHEYCSHCWTLGSDWDTECPVQDPVACPQDFPARLQAARRIWNATGSERRTKTPSSARRKRRKQSQNEPAP